jgi:hypothetical protein
LTDVHQCFTIGQSNQSIRFWKGGFDEAANGVTLWVKSGGRDIFNLMWESGEPATAEIYFRKPQHFNR